MGCVENKRPIRINSIKKNKNKLRNSLSLGDRYPTIKEEEVKNLIKNKSQRITNILWIKILNYLNYKELKETGKVNRFFNKTSKQKELLIKFFQKKDTDHNNFFKFFYEEKNPIINTILSFSILRNQNYFDDEYSDLSINNRENQ